MLTLAAGMGASCGDAESEPAQSTYCRYDFEGSVRKGPNAGMTLHGQLYLVEKSPSHTEGGLYIPASGSTPEQHIPATGEIDAANNLTLTFTLDGGKTIHGTGALPAPFAMCAAPFGGSLVGFAAGDEGDWVTSFFGSGGSSTPTCTVPIIKNPRYYGGRMLMDAAGSCIMLGATARLRPTASTVTNGPYTLGFDMSGTLLQTPTLGPTIVPAGSCHMLDVSNPSGQAAQTTVVCR